MSGWGSDPHRKPMAHKDQAKKWRKRNAATIQATKPKTEESTQKS